MFGFFSKRNKIEESDYEFLRKISASLPKKYAYLKEQVHKDFIINKERNVLADEYTYSLVLNANLESKYQNLNLPQYFIIRDIFIWNTKKHKYEDIELHIVEGRWSGFRIVSKYDDLDFNRIDVSKIKEKTFKNSDKEEVERILGNMYQPISNYLSLDGTFKIEIEEGIFYTLKELGDGNYLAMDKHSAVYGMIHDPYEVEKLFDNKELFFEALESGSFNIEKYYEDKFS